MGGLKAPQPHLEDGSVYRQNRPTNVDGRYHHLRDVAWQPVGAPRPCDSRSVTHQSGGTGGTSRWSFGGQILCNSTRGHRRSFRSEVTEDFVTWLRSFDDSGYSQDSPPDMVGSCLVCFQGVSGCRPGVTHDMIGHRTGSRAPSLRVSAAVRCQLWLFSGRRRHGQAWQLGRVAYKPMLQAGLLCSIRLGSQRQYPLPRPEQQLV